MSYVFSILFRKTYWYRATFQPKLKEISIITVRIQLHGRLFEISKTGKAPWPPIQLLGVMIRVISIVSGVSALVASLTLSAIVISDSLRGLDRTEDQIVQKFEGAAQMDIFGLGFGFGVIVLLVIHTVLLLVVNYLTKDRKYFQLLMGIATLAVVVSVIFFYKDYSREMALWNSAYA